MAAPHMAAGRDLDVVHRHGVLFGSAANTGPILQAVISWGFGELDPITFERLHASLRKGGHFLGYGILGYVWLRAFVATFPKGRRYVWAGLAIACTFVIASLDEWHQSFSPPGPANSVMLCLIPAERFCLCPWLSLRSGGLIKPRRPRLTPSWLLSHLRNARGG